MSSPDPLLDAALEAGDIAILGKKGSGKTFAAKGLVERLLDMGRRVLVIDPLSSWWGLKYLTDGKSAGFPVPVFGGPEADIPITAGSGIALGQLLMKTDISAVLDVGAMSRRDGAGLVADLLEHLFQVNKKDPLWLVLEEADVFAPQERKRDIARVLDAVDQIVRRGRALGFQVISITQRAAKLNKDVLTQVSTLISLGVTGKPDRDAIREWVGGHGDPDKAKDVYDSLAQLKVGEGWIWTPELGSLERVNFPPIRTLDTSKTPSTGNARMPVHVRVGLDIDKLKAMLAKMSARGARKATAKADGIKHRKIAVNRASKKQRHPKKRAVNGVNVGAAILRARKAAGLTQEQLGKRLETNQGNIARLERDGTNATVTTLQSVAAATGHRLIIDFQPRPKKVE